MLPGYRQRCIFWPHREISDGIMEVMLWSDHLGTMSVLSEASYELWSCVCRSFLSHPHLHLVGHSAGWATLPSINLACLGYFLALHPPGSLMRRWAHFSDPYGPRWFWLFLPGFLLASPGSCLLLNTPLPVSTCLHCSDFSALYANSILDYLSTQSLNLLIVRTWTFSFD